MSYLIILLEDCSNTSTVEILAHSMLIIVLYSITWHNDNVSNYNERHIECNTNIFRLILHYILLP